MSRGRLGLVFFDGAKLRSLREDRRLTRAQLAALLDAQPASIGRWETGEQKPDPRAVRALAQTFAVPVIALTCLESYDDDRVALAQLRMLRGLTRPEAAAELGITATLLGTHEHGRRHPDSELTEKLAALYEVTTTQVVAAAGRTHHRGAEHLDALRDQARRPGGTL